MLQGHVYRKADGTPLIGLPVSDGRHVTKTDATGAFSLPGWERARVVFVSVLTHAHNDWYAMTEGHVGDYDFFLDPVTAPDTHSFLHLSDTEIGVDGNTDGCGAWLEDVKALVASEHPAFLIHTGDICRKAGLLRHYKDMNEQTVGCPVRYTLGNHDFVNENYGEYTYEVHYGPAWYSFDLGNVHYAVLPIQKGEAPSGYDPADSRHWLVNDLALCDPQKKLIVFCHDLCRYSEESFVLDVAGDALDLKEHNLLAWVFGHLHTHYINDCDGRYNVGTANPACGGIDSSPAGTRRVTVCADGTLTSAILYNGLQKAEAGDPFRWRASLAGHVLFCTPIVQNGRLFVATADDGHPKTCGIYCLDAETGEILWHLPSRHSFKNDMCFADGRLFAMNAYAEVICLDPENGSVEWTTALDCAHPHHTAASLIVSDGRVFAQTCSNVASLSASDGQLLWQTEHFRDHAESPVRMLLHDGRLIVGKQWGMLYALDPVTGERLWENKEASHRVSRPLAVGDTLYVTHLFDLFVIDARTGETKRRQALSDEKYDLNTASSPVLCQGHLLLPSAGGGLLRVDPETLTVNGSFACDKPMVPATPYATHDAPATEGTPVTVGEHVIFVGSDGYLRIGDVNTTEEKHRIFVGAPSYVSVTRHKDTLIVADLCGRITAYRMPAWLS